MDMIDMMEMEEIRLSEDKLVLETLLKTLLKTVNGDKDVENTDVEKI